MSVQTTSVITPAFEPAPAKVAGEVPSPPAWWAMASCRGQGAEQWLVARGEVAKVLMLRGICRACPTSGECLAAAISLPILLRRLGPMRCGVTGGKSWAQVERVVSRRRPSSAHEWEALAAQLLQIRPS